MIGALLTLFVFGIVGLVVISVLMALVGIAISVTFGLLGVLLFKVAPVLLIGWLVLKIIGRARGRPRISTADQRWLDS